MDMRETRISGEYFFEGRIMKARVDEVRLPNGKQASREVCEHVGGVGVLPIGRDGNIILVRQFRYPFDTETLEMPAGKMDHGPENAEECGVRELAEETGLSVEEIADADLASAAPESFQQEMGDGLTLETLLGTESPEESLIEQLSLRAAIDLLPERERMTILLRFFKALTQEQTARVLGVSQVQVSRLERRALQKLRTAMETEG